LIGLKKIAQMCFLKMHGQGTFTFDGIKYVGEFQDDKMHGQATVTWANGTKYVGEFQDSKFYGQGTYTYADAEDMTQQDINKQDEKGFMERVLADVIAGYPAAKLEAKKRQEAYNRGVRRGEAARRARCNNQQGNC
jgi:hypothetical protein